MEPFYSDDSGVIMSHIDEHISELGFTEASQHVDIETHLTLECLTITCQGQKDQGVALLRQL